MNHWINEWMNEWTFLSCFLLMVAILVYCCIAVIHFNQVMATCLSVNINYNLRNEKFLSFFLFFSFLFPIFTFFSHLINVHFSICQNNLYMHKIIILKTKTKTIPFFHFIAANRWNKIHFDWYFFFVLLSFIFLFSLFCILFSGF